MLAPVVRKQPKAVNFSPDTSADESQLDPVDELAISFEATMIKLMRRKASVLNKLLRKSR